MQSVTILKQPVWPVSTQKRYYFTFTYLLPLCLVLLPCCWLPAQALATRTQDKTPAMESITAVVLGGTSFMGGRGNVLGTLVGALIVGVFRNGLQLMGIPSVYQVLITGVLVILAVSVDQLSHRGK